MIYRETDMDAADRLLSMIPIEKYPFADPIWKIKENVFSGKQFLVARYNEEKGEVDGVMVYYFTGNICNVVILYAPLLVLSGGKKLIKELMDFFGKGCKSMRFWTTYSRQWERLAGAKPIYTMMEVSNENLQ